jgi:hypothetical protein
MKNLQLANHLTAEATKLLRESLLAILSYPFGLPEGVDSMNIDQLLAQIYNERKDAYARMNSYAREKTYYKRTYDEVLRDRLLDVL